MTVLPVRIAPPVRRLAESRPPCRTWHRVRAPAPVAARPVPAAPGPPAEAPNGVASPRRPGRVVVVRSGWTADPDGALPDAAGWSGSLAVAVVEALLARRPVAQLNRWLSEEVLASVTRQQRLRRARPGVASAPLLVSARVQHPAPRVAEVAAFLRVGTYPLVLAFRLEALGERWLCTALELGSRGEDDPPAGLRPAGA